MNKQRDTFWSEFTIAWSLVAIFFAACMYALFEIDERDYRIRQIQRAQSACIPARPRDLATAQMMADGRIECAISRTVGGRRQAIERMEF